MIKCNLPSAVIGGVIGGIAYFFVKAFFVKRMPNQYFLASTIALLTTYGGLGLIAIAFALIYSAFQ